MQPSIHERQEPVAPVKLEEGMAPQAIIIKLVKAAKKINKAFHLLRRAA